MVWRSHTGQQHKSKSWVLMGDRRRSGMGYVRRKSMDWCSAWIIWKGRKWTCSFLLCWGKVILWIELRKATVKILTRLIRSPFLCTFKRWVAANIAVDPRIQNAQCKRWFAWTGHICDTDNFMQRNVHINVFEKVNTCARYFHMVRNLFLSYFLTSCISFHTIAPPINSWIIIAKDWQRKTRKKAAGILSYFKTFWRSISLSGQAIKFKS